MTAGFPSILRRRRRSHWLPVIPTPQPDHSMPRCSSAPSTAAELSSSGSSANRSVPPMTRRSSTALWISPGAATSPTTRWRRFAACSAGAVPLTVNARPHPGGDTDEPGRRGRYPDAAAGLRWLRGAGRCCPSESRPTRRAHALAESLLDRYGVVTRGSVVAERAPGGFAAATGCSPRSRTPAGAGGDISWKVSVPLSSRGPGAVDRLRSDDTASRDRAETQTVPRAVVVAATDPANAYGAALPWPDRGAVAATGHRPGRKAGARSWCWSTASLRYMSNAAASRFSPGADDPGRLQPAVDALALAVREGQLGRLVVERADGAGVLTSPLGHVLEAAGFRATPRGLRLRA